MKNSKIWKEVWNIGWPASVEAVFAGLAGIFDVAMVGRLGSAATAGVGLTNQPKFICMAFIIALNVGVTALVARRIGEGKPEEASATFRESLTLSLMISVVVNGLAFIFARPFLKFAGGNAEMIDVAIVYFRWLLPGMLLQQLCMTMNAGLRCSGNVRISMWTGLVSSVVNVIMNYLLIEGRFGFPAWGVKGAAIATSIGSAVAFLMSVVCMLSKRCSLRVKTVEGWIPKRRTIRGLSMVSSGAFFENFFLRVGFFIYAVLAAKLGTIAFAAHQISMNNLNMLLLAFDGIAVAAAALVGQNLGANRVDRAKESIRACMMIAAAFSVVFGIVCTFAREPIMLAFSRDPEVIRYGMDLHLIIAASLFGASMMDVYSGGLRGAGDTKFVAFSSLASTTVIRPALAWYLCYFIGWGLYGLWVALLIDVWMRGVLAMYWYKKGKWALIRI